MKKLSYYKTVQEWRKDCFKEVLKSALEGNRIGQFYVGQMYLRGDGTAQNFEEGYKWILKSAKNGHVPAKEMMGHLLCIGKSVQKDTTKGLRWLSTVKPHERAHIKSSVATKLPEKMITKQATQKKLAI